MKHRILKYPLLISVFVITLLISSLCAFAFPATPYWSHFSGITADMEVNDYNWATIDVMCDSDAATVDSLTVTLELQQLDGDWETIETWVESENDSTISFVEEAVIPKNYSYRLKVTAEAYSGSTLLEEVTEYFRYGYYS